MVEHYEYLYHLSTSSENKKVGYRVMLQCTKLLNTDLLLYSIIKNTDNKIITAFILLKNVWFKH